MKKANVQAICHCSFWGKTLCLLSNSPLVFIPILATEREKRHTHTHTHTHIKLHTYHSHRTSKINLQIRPRNTFTVLIEGYCDMHCCTKDFSMTTPIAFSHSSSHQQDMHKLCTMSLADTSDGTTTYKHGSLPINTCMGPCVCVHIDFTLTHK